MKLLHIYCPIHYRIYMNFYIVSSIVHNLRKFMLSILPYLTNLIRAYVNINLYFVLDFFCRTEYHIIINDKIVKINQLKEK